MSHKVVTVMLEICMSVHRVLCWSKFPTEKHGEHAGLGLKKYVFSVLIILILCSIEDKFKKTFETRKALHAQFSAHTSSLFRALSPWAL